MYSQIEIYNLNIFISFQRPVFIVKTFLWQITWWTDKQYELYPHLGILFSNEKSQNTDTCYNMNKASETLCWIKEARHKRLHIIYFHLYKMLRDANLQNLKVDWCLPGTGSEDGEWLQVGTSYPWRWCNSSTVGCGDGCKNL